MTSRSRGRPRKSNTARNKRIDAALDAMRPYGFDEALVRQTVDELLDVYDGEWFFIEDVSYRILVDTMLDKQQISSEEKDDARREGDNETSAATLTTAISEASSSNLVHHDSLLRTCDGSKSLITNDPKDSASLDGGDQTEQTKIEGMAVEPENQKKLADAIVNNREQGAKPVEKSSVRPPAIQSPQPCKDLPVRRRKPCYGWLSDSDEEDLVHLPLPPLPEEIKKLLEQNAAPQRSSQRRRTSRWDGMPSDMTT